VCSASGCIYSTAQAGLLRSFSYHDVTEQYNMDHILLLITRRRQAYFRTLYNRRKNALSRTYLIYVQDADKSVVYFFSYVPFRNGLRLPSPTPSLLRVARSPAAPPLQSAAGPVTALRSLCDQDRIRRIVSPLEGQQNARWHQGQRAIASAKTRLSSRAQLQRGEAVRFSYSCTRARQRD